MLKKIRFSKKTTIIAAVFVAILIVIIAVVWAKSRQTKLANAEPVSIVDICSKDDDVRFSCYKKELTDVTKDQGPEKAFMLVKQQYSKNSYVKSQCHQLVHIIGRAAYAKYGNIADTFGHGDQFCWAGYYHGIMEQVADKQGTDKFLANLNTICAAIEAKAPYSFNHYNCVHGLGHGVMEALNGNLFEALAACDRLTESYNSGSCYGGVFMQNIMTVQSPDETVDHSSAYLKPDQPMYPCTAIDDKYKLQCYLMQTSYALQVEGYDFNKVFNLCDQTPEAYRDTCYQSLGRDASGQSVSDVEKTKAKCLLGANFEAQSNCIIGASKDFTAYFHGNKQAKQLCTSLPQELQAICYSTVKNFSSTF